MPFLIDGYNLLHATGIFGRGRAPGSLQRSRQALLNFLAESLAAEDLPRTVVVFDAAEAPPGLPRMVLHRGLTVRYAERHSEADDLIEELIKLDSAPRKLTVVSSDHRLQRAARRRRATAVDSDVWYAQVREARQQRREERTPQKANPGLPLSDAEVRAWMKEFGEEEPELNDPPNDSIYNPFPPGYGEDVEE